MNAEAKTTGNPVNVDLFEFCRQERVLDGNAALADLTRLELAERSGTLTWRAVGARDGRGNPVLELAVAGSVVLTCQRCLEPFVLPLDIAAAYRVVRSEAEAEELPLDDEEFDPVVGSAQFDLIGLVEDEVLLSLPAVARHEQCPVDLVAEHADAKRPSPFAALAGLKSK